MVQQDITVSLFSDTVDRFLKEKVETWLSSGDSFDFFPIKGSDLHTAVLS